MWQDIITYAIIFWAFAHVLYKLVIKNLIKGKKKSSAFCSGCTKDCSTCPFASSYSAAYHYKSLKLGSAGQSPKVQDKTHTAH